MLYNLLMMCFCVVGRVPYLALSTTFAAIEETSARCVCVHARTCVCIGVCVCVCLCVCGCVARQHFVLKEDLVTLQ